MQKKNSIDTPFSGICFERRVRKTIFFVFSSLVISISACDSSELDKRQQRGDQILHSMHKYKLERGLCPHNLEDVQKVDSALEVTAFDRRTFNLREDKNGSCILFFEIKATRLLCEKSTTEEEWFCD